MTLDSLPLARWAAPGALAATLLLAAASALAQDEAAAPEGTDASVPAEAVEPAEGTADPAAAEAAPSEAAGQTPDVIPVQTGEAEAAPSAVQLDKVEVTGSRLKRTDYESAQPVLVISREDIERTGLTSIGELLQDLPQAGAALNTAFNGFVDVGGIEVDLRNLGSNRVLVLVNGHRWVNGLRSLSTSSVDLSTIPISIIERIEVLKDGASAIYGSDAIAGVVNIITRRDYTGAQLRAYTGNYFEESDGLTQQYGLSFGNTINDTNLFLDLSYTSQQEIFNGDRELTRLPIFGTGVSRGSGNTPQGRLIFIPENASTTAALTASDPNACQSGLVAPAGICAITTRVGTDGTSFDDFKAFDFVNDPYNFATENYLLTPYTQSAMFGQIARNFGEISVRSELLYNLRRSEQRSAHMPIIGGDLTPPPFNKLYIDRNNFYNILDQDIGRSAGGGAPLGPGSGAFGRRPLEYAAREFSQDVDTIRAGVTVGGPLDLAIIRFDRILDWEVGYSRGESKESEVSTGFFNLQRMGLALGPSFQDPATGRITCGTPGAPIPDCVPLNLFGGQGVDGKGTITQEMLDYIGYVSVGSSGQTLRNVFASAGLDLFQLPAGPLGLAVGWESRRESFEQTPDPLIVAGISSSNQSSPTSGSVDVSEFYAELGIPLLADVPFVQALDLALAGRRSDYATFGVAETGKIGLRYKPFDDLLVRGTYSTAFRAPNVGELFLGGSVSFPGLSDPCSADIRATEPNAQTNCSADGVPAQQNEVAAQRVGIFSGNPDLDPETAKTYTAGVVYSPEFVPDLNLYVDWYRVDIDDFITVAGEQFILDSCYRNDPSQRAFCGQVQRNSSGTLQAVLNPFLNFARLETEGVDLTADYRLPWFKQFGDFKVVADAAYLIKYNQYSPGAGGVEVETRAAGQHFAFGPFPRWKANAAFDWKQGKWNASWSMRYIHHMEETCNDQIFSPTLAEYGVCSNPLPEVADDPATVDDPATPEVENNEALPDRSTNKLKALIYHSMQIGYAFGDGATKFTLGINNVLDTETPPSYAFLQSPTWDFTAHEIPGRFGYLRLQRDF